MLTEAEIWEWIVEKRGTAESEFTARRQMESCWKGGSDESWAAVGCIKNRSERTKESKTHGRIAMKCQRDVDMFNNLLNILATVKEHRELLRKALIRLGHDDDCPHHFEGDECVCETAKVQSQIEEALK